MLCTLLALGLVVAMLPTWGIKVQAASQMTSSERLIDCIKAYEGFRSQAYVSGGQWTIGYGTSAQPGDTITREEADRALREHLRSLESRLERFMDKFDLDLSQNEFDALASFTYNCGIGWMNESGRFRDAVTEGASEEQFLFAISLWANNGSKPDSGLLKRRLLEANIYLNNDYESAGEYTYTIFDANGGTPGHNGEDKMQGYRRSGATQILVKDPVRSGREFLGWYTAKTGGAKVTVLNSQTAGKTLYARYGGSDEEEDVKKDETVIATGTVKCTTYVNIRRGAGTQYPLAGKAAAGTKVSLYEIEKSGTSQWGRTKDGWICMDYVTLDKTESGTTSSYQEGVVSADLVNVRSGPGTGYAVLDQYSRGTEVKVYEEQQGFGRISGTRWICMAYVTLGETSGSASKDDAKEEPKEDTKEEALAGRFTGSGSLNVRSGPGTAYPRVGALQSGTWVTILEKTQASGTQWGRIAKDQWVCMNYITLEETASESQESGQGTVSSYTNLNVRTGAGTNYSLAAKLAPGTKVRILEQTKVSGKWWGRTSQGWVCMDYIQMD